MGAGWIWPVVLLLGMAALVWGLMRARSAGRSGVEERDEPRSDGDARARDILRERFARGEITEEELRERLRVLDER
jgi:putative membrane protein